MQQPQGGGGSQYRVSSSSSEMAAPFASPTTALRTQMPADNLQQQQQQQLVEEASPISSRPPAGNFDELTGDEDLHGGISGGNRWPRQETLALLKIRSEMDIAFRDATLKSPLWEEVSRKLGELGYTRSAKKCKEKFENVQKYYKRTKEGRAGRQDGKSYRFFTQLEALHGTSIGTTGNISNVSPAPAPVTTRSSPANAAPISIGIGSSDPRPVSSVQIPPPIMGASQVFPPSFTVSMAPATITPPAAGTAIGISFSCTSSSSASESEEDGDELEAEPSNPSSSLGQKRKRVSEKGGSSGTNNKMMEFFESLMRKVMQKQEAMQQRFLETIEKREHDRMIREEAWKRQEMSRLAREHELLVQDRAIASSRDAAIIAFLQKITGQNIQLPTAASTIPAAPIPPQATVPPQQSQPLPPPPPQQQQQQQPPQHQGQQHHQHQPHQSPNSDQVIRHQSPINSMAIMAVPEQQVAPQETGGGGSFDPTSSRWPKVEVLALIKLRSALEARYLEAGPKGPLWEDISNGMQQIGYKRNAKRCKEKWENINKYFKKVKESNKSRPEDAKTCPYFHELDALYRKKILGGTSGGAGGDGSSGSSFGHQNMLEQQQQQQQQPGNMATNSQEQDRSNLAGITTAPQILLATESENNKGDSTIVQSHNGVTLFGQGSNSIKKAGGGHKKPEDIVKELIVQQQQQQLQQLMTGGYDKVGEPDHSDDMDQEEDEDDENADYDESEEEMKMGYKIEFQPKQKSSPSNRGGNGTPSFVAMVQ